MSKLRSGTYCRESDGATQLYHNDSTGWNFPKASLMDFLERGAPQGSIHHWDIVRDEEEINELRDFLGGSHLKPGENTEVTTYDIRMLEQE